MIPPVSNPKWSQLIKGEISFDYKLLALKIMLTRLQQKVKANPASVADSIKELADFFTKNEKLLADDIKTIFG